jgi:hypothetical protein
MAQQRLTERIVAARRELSTLDAKRRQCNAELARILSAVEGRFAARTIERDHVQRGLLPLAEANRTLAELADRLAALAERTAAADREATARFADGLAMAAPAAPAWRFEDVSAEELYREDRAAASIGAGD